tara:strand:+ start:286 stop:459 length:174 start_codon:yes stop_codon:yes gene_type:complete
MSEMVVDLNRLNPDKVISSDGFNEGKVTRIREAWKTGEYSPDSKEIAGHLVEWLKSE